MWKEGVRIYDTLLFYIYDDFYQKFNEWILSLMW